MYFFGIFSLQGFFGKGILSKSKPQHHRFESSYQGLIRKNCKYIKGQIMCNLNIFKMCSPGLSQFVLYNHDVLEER